MQPAPRRVKGVLSMAVCPNCKGEGKRFEELKIPLYITATDLNNGKSQKIDTEIPLEQYQDLRPIIDNDDENIYLLIENYLYRLEI